jgi:hypothetical protein
VPQQAPDRSTALARLDPPSRALVELSEGHGLGPDEIADFLRVDPAEAARRRDEALARLDAELEGNGSSARRSRGAIVAIGLALLAVVAVVVALATGDDSEQAARSDRAGQAAEGPRAEAPSAGTVRTMERLNGTNGRGTAQLVRRDEPILRMRATSFLEPNGGGYAVWLSNSPDDARRLFATTSTTISRDIVLPRAFTRYRYVEVARAVPELNSDHSSLTLLRVRTKALATND